MVHIPTGTYSILQVYSMWLCLHASRAHTIVFTYHMYILLCLHTVVSTYYQMHILSCLHIVMFTYCHVYISSCVHSIIVFTCLQ